MSADFLAALVSARALCSAIASDKDLYALKAFLLDLADDGEDAVDLGRRGITMDEWFPGIRIKSLEGDNVDGSDSLNVFPWQWNKSKGG